GIFLHTRDIAPLAGKIETGLKRDIATIGLTGILALFLRAFSFGAGTFTGIEAVSNGMQIMREPKVKTGKKTMAYMASSLAITACGLFMCYYLFDVKPVEGKTLNTVLAGMVFEKWPFGAYIAFITILSEGILLIVAAQTGFIDGPRVMANMAIDSWLPRRFSSLSERLTMQNGILIMGIATISLLFYTHGSVSALLVMYSINVFITFSLSQLGMIFFFIKNKEKDKAWARHIVIHIIGFFICITILLITVYEKFTEGGWITLLITGMLICICYIIKSHYGQVRNAIRHLEETIEDIPTYMPYNNDPVKKSDMTAIILVNGFNGFGIHTLLSVVRYFPNVYKNYIFLSVAVVDSGVFKGASEICALVETRKAELMKYVTITRKHGFPADYRISIGTDVVEEAIKLTKETVNEFPKSMVFTGRLIFEKENMFHKILHNETAYAIQRHLQWEGIPTTILPIRIHAKKDRLSAKGN
ncbi:MAG: amino acid permease, partial [Syntrophorhabdaceae bacterium]|nr:amino acid permease [Syntrophorhabdaceae bacterium]